MMVKTPKHSNQSSRPIGVVIARERSLSNQNQVAATATAKRMNPITPVSSRTSTHTLCTVDTSSSPKTARRTYLPPALAP